mgnify:CR=1|tara:strand:+ start:25900 stop:26142 length:243 start_codon:yes stop_codon:yes gene_type:complete
MRSDIAAKALLATRAVISLNSDADSRALQNTPNPSPHDPNMLCNIVSSADYLPQQQSLDYRHVAHIDRRNPTVHKLMNTL